MNSESNQIAIAPAPASTLPFDVLNHIFLYCIPTPPLECIQPNNKIAPLLLCHVCSSWRQTALAAPSLWSHLYIRLPILWGVIECPKPVIWQKRDFRHSMECLLFWMKNQGSIAPFIRIGFDKPVDNSKLSTFWLYEGDKGMALPSKILQFFVQYLSSAQYLDVGFFSQHLFKQDGDKRFKSECPNLHSLVMRYPDDDSDNEEEGGSEHESDTSDDGLHYIHDMRLVPPCVPPTVRRISIYQDKPPLESFNDWSNITHLSLQGTILSVSTWFTFIRGFPSLQWGNFNVAVLEEFFITAPASMILHSLKTLSINVDTYSSIGIEYPLTFAFINLELPAVESLALRSEAEKWRHSKAIKDVNGVLKLAPAVKKLALGPEFIHGIRSNVKIFNKKHFEGEQPLSIIAPQLIHLELDLCFDYEDIFDERDHFAERVVHWQDLFFSTHWLDLSSPQNTVRTVSIYPKQFAPYDPFTNPVPIRNAVRKAIEEYAKKAHNVEFRFLMWDDRETSPKGWKTWI
ncbi:hypothetical protein BDN70DRAFT_931624 [Pholiota conissans]|uniref:F-box domain-containing protein n=1 Tax=Pholiota conissans TaxID=109636 RepID=A0A9P6CVD1_9AGAR|nr:hypothetical protein BDN70DRAFT_931624 [Pholiota conissans]